MHSHLHKSVLCLDKPFLLPLVVEQLLPLPLQWIGGQQQEFLHQLHWHPRVLPVPLHCCCCWELVGICHSSARGGVEHLLHQIIGALFSYSNAFGGFLFYFPIQKADKQPVISMHLVGWHSTCYTSVKQNTGAVAAAPT